MKTAQFVYTLEIKDKEEVISLIEKWKHSEITKINFKLGLHLKQFQIQDIWILKKEEGDKRYVKKGEPMKMPCQKNLRYTVKNPNRRRVATTRGIYRLKSKRKHLRTVLSTI
jgi:hypothetical protein